VRAALPVDGGTFLFISDRQVMVVSGGQQKRGVGDKPSPLLLFDGYVRKMGVS